MSFRPAMIAFCLLSLASAVAAFPPCHSIKSQPDVWVGESVDALVTTARKAFADDDHLPAYQKVLDRISATMQQCKVSEDSAFLGRYRNFVEYVETISLDRRPDHELGFVVSDKQYFAETRAFVEIPEFLLDRKFLGFVSRSETLERAKSYLRLLNLKRAPAEQLIFFSYQSRHLGTPDNDDSFRRLLIVVPGNAETGVPEKWVQFGITDPRKRVRIRNVSVVSAVAGLNGSFDTYFKDYFRTYRRDGSIRIDGRWELGYGDDNCAKCHKSGILPIFPVAGSVSAAEQSAVVAVNQRFQTYGSPKLGKYLDQRKFGPGLSSASLDNRQQRFGAAFTATAVGRAMTCTACHQAERFGSLSWPMDSTLIESYVTGGQMPFGYQLPGHDRADLYQKLVDEYFAIDQANPGILKAWLLSKPR